MYKITLRDECCGPLFEGAVSFFTEAIEDFERRWTAGGLVEPDVLDRFRRSRGGEVVTDLESDDPAYNIVVQQPSVVLKEKSIVLKEADFEATNAYAFSKRYYVAEWALLYRWIRFGDSLYRIVSYEAGGCCQWDEYLQRWTALHCWGNPVLENTVAYRPVYLTRVGREQWENPEPAAFAGNSVRTICFLAEKSFASVQELERDYEAFQIDGEEMDFLFRDVIGEAG